MNDQDTRNQRGETARRHDDSAIIDAAGEGPDHQGRSGGNLQLDVATQSEEERVRDADAQEGVTKEDDIAHGQRREVPRPATHVVTERD